MSGAVAKIPLSRVRDRMFSTVSLVTSTSLPPSLPYSLDSESSSPKPELSRYSNPDRSTTVAGGALLSTIARGDPLLSERDLDTA